MCIHDSPEFVDRTNQVDVIIENVMKKLNVSEEPVNFVTNGRSQGGIRNRWKHYAYAENRYNIRPGISTQNSLRCRNCQSTDHLVRSCPTRFCQSCGEMGHDSWNKSCQKYLWLTDGEHSDQFDTLNDERSTAVVKCVIKELLTHATIDWDAGCPLLSKDVLDEIIEPDFNILKPTKNLIDTSGNIMDIVGTVWLPIKVIGTKIAKMVEFCVVNSSYAFILLGRNFMRLYRNVTRLSFITRRWSWEYIVAKVLHHS